MKGINQKGLFASILISLATHAVFAEDDIMATPYRPSVSTPAMLSAPGWLEAEFGWQRVNGGEVSRRDTLPYTLKLAFSPEWGVRLTGDAWIENTDFNGARIRSVGDTGIVLKRRFSVSDTAAFGLEGGIISPTAKDEIGVSKPDYLLNGIYSIDLGKYHIDSNLIGTRVGHVGANESRWQTTWAVALSRPLNDKWSVVSEFSGTHQKNVSDTAQFLTAVSYNFSKRVVFDVGASWGITPVSQDWSLFTGITVLIGRVY